MNSVGSNITRWTICFVWWSQWDLCGAVGVASLLLFLWKMDIHKHAQAMLSWMIHGWGDKRLLGPSLVLQIFEIGSDPRRILIPEFFPISFRVQSKKSFLIFSDSDRNQANSGWNAAEFQQMQTMSWKMSKNWTQLSIVFVVVQQNLSSEPLLDHQCRLPHTRGLCHWASSRHQVQHDMGRSLGLSCIGPVHHAIVAQQCAVHTGICWQPVNDPWLFQIQTQPMWQSSPWHEIPGGQSWCQCSTTSIHLVQPGTQAVGFVVP